LTFLGREGLGNPTREAQYQIQQVEQLINEKEESPSEAAVQGVIAFLADQIALNVEETPIPVIRGAKLKGYLRSRSQKALSRSAYLELESLFDSVGGKETEET
jgi:CRISPR/Cas system CMR subunit Cmr4 (Cas7 group RAMP superfamily)